MTADDAMHPISLCDHCIRNGSSCPIEPEQPVTVCVEARPIDARAARTMQRIAAREPHGWKTLCLLIEAEADLRG